VERRLPTCSERMRVTMINPPAFINLSALGTSMNPTLPIGLAYVTAAARQQGHDLRVVDAVALAPTGTAARGALIRVGAGVDEIVAAVPTDSEVVGVACIFSHAWPFVRELLSALRNHRPGAFLALGGGHASALAELVLDQSTADCVVVGEGELTFCDVLTRLASGSRDLEGVAGVVYADARGIHRNPPRRRIADLSALERPAWDLFSPELYFQQGFDSGVSLGRAMPIVATRGCPYDCTFCASPQMWACRYVARDVVDVVDEMQALHEHYDVVSFLFQDLTAVLSRRWMRRFTEELIRRQLPIQWQFPTGTRCDILDDELAALMVDSGCRFISFAPETGSDARRDQLGKRMSSSALYAAVEASVRAGLKVTCFFIVGIPGDTTADHRATVVMVQELARRGVSDIACHYYYPTPGSRIYRDLLAAGRLTQSDEELMAPLLGDSVLLRAEHCMHEHLGPWQQFGRRLEIYLRFYDRRYLRRPWALLRLVTNLLQGRQTNKLEAFVPVFCRKLRLRRR
jgi:radical SAM superfamily enzyme YgiQ (UPF0313 family)